jgi:hypothetical protein
MRETPRAAQAWADYLALGPDRSLAKLLHRYQTASNPPTRRLKSLADWSAAFDWQGRLRAIADEQASAAQEAQRQYIASIMETGFGLPHERVAVLKRLAGVLLDELTADGDDNRRWVSEMKRYGLVERFNRGEFETLRGLLDDIAKETGGRVHKTELTGKDGGAIETAGTLVHIYLPDNGRENTPDDDADD